MSGFWMKSKHGVVMVCFVAMAMAMSACRQAQHSPGTHRSPEQAALATTVVDSSTAQIASQPAATPRVVHPFEGVTVIPDVHEVHVDSVSCLDEGYLEQIACSPHTREHESLVVTKVRPSEVHAALLMAGLSPGSPGRWIYETDSYSVIAPKGDSVDVFVRYANVQGSKIEEPVQNWMREVTKTGFLPFPPGVWVFGGSRFESNPEFMGPGEHYVADMTGSIIGLVTFGDEVVGFARVMPDSADVSEPVWEVDPERVPPIGTPVTLILRKTTNGP
jgi:hypothetical protein